MNIQRISAMNFVQKNNLKTTTQTQSNHNATDTISFGLRIPSEPEIRALLEKAPGIRQEAAAIVEEVKTLLQRIQSGQTEGIRITGGFAYILDSPNSTKSSRRFCLGRGGLANFWKHDPETEEMISSFCFLPGNRLLSHDIYHPNAPTDVIIFDRNGQVSYVAKFDSERNVGFRTEIFGDTDIGDTSFFRGVHSLIPRH